MFHHYLNTMRFRWSLILPAVAFVVAISSTEPAVAVEKLKMISDWAFQAQSVVFINAIDKGYFAEQGLEVTEALALPRKPTVDEVLTDKFLPPKKDRTL
jgi:ABC-type nitrate/sulfonate/bicarbonate transport system substrate-binding protein